MTTELRKQLAEAIRRALKQAGFEGLDLVTDAILLNRVSSADRVPELVNSAMNYTPIGRQGAGSPWYRELAKQGVRNPDIEAMSERNRELNLKREDRSREQQWRERAIELETIDNPSRAIELEAEELRRNINRGEVVGFETMEDEINSVDLDDLDNVPTETLRSTILQYVWGTEHEWPNAKRLTNQTWKDRIIAEIVEPIEGMTRSQLIYLIENENDFMDQITVYDSSGDGYTTKGVNKAIRAIRNALNH